MTSPVADSSTPHLPLAGVRVLDLSRVLAGPLCCQVLADLGADVVKVERPGTGDDTRAWGPPFLPEGGTSAYYLSCNRGKRSLALDLAHPQARAVLDALLMQADCLVENFLPGSLARLGLDDARVRQLNPRIVRASISGYGRSGPMAEVPGYDLAVQAFAGLMAITGPVEGPPMKVGVAMADVLAGLYAAIALLAGLHARGASGTGATCDLALADCTLASLVNVAQGALVTSLAPQRWGNAHPQIVPYEPLAAQDGHFILAVGNDGQWQRFCTAVGHADWAVDPRFATNPVRVAHRRELLALLEPLARARTVDQWHALLAAHDVPHGPVLGVDEALAHPQVAARGMVLPATDGAGRSFRLVASPLHWEGDPPRTSLPAPPALGEHSDEVLRDWLAFTPVQIAALRQSGALG
ncbi:MAG: CoA transferase [Pirellulales bacterium]|nr:CoA transferase [Pirellulales bacterium]